jgi:hypothetical protein
LRHATERGGDELLGTGGLPAVNTKGGFLDSFFAAGGNLDPAVLAEIDAILNPPIISTALH